ncbi:MAG: hypothetical protein NTV51_10965 [Verrucomicrobia bacterium]|nr:hypothetical protein [Verrucomicrobiota bacterium]
MVGVAAGRVGAAEAAAVAAAGSIARQHISRADEDVRHLREGDPLYAFRVSKEVRGVVAAWEQRGARAFVVEKQREMNRISDGSGRAAWVHREDRILVVLDGKLVATLSLARKPPPPALTGCAAEWEPFKADVTQRVFPKAGSAFDHLFPGQMPPSPLASRVPYTYLARYSSRPSWFPGTDVYVVRDPATDVFRLHCQWSEIETKEPLSRVVEIPPALAAVIYEVWANALLEVRYDRASNIGLDGTTYYFSTWVRGLGTLDGMIWMPGGDLPPAWMVEAGEYLAKFARQDRPEVAAAQKYFESLKTRLFRHYASR